MATSKPSVGAGSTAGNVENPAKILDALVKLSSDETRTEFIRLCLSKMHTEHSPQAPTTTKNSRKPTCKTESKSPKAVILEGLIKLSADEDNGDTIRLILSNMGTEDSPQAPTTTKNSRKPTCKTGRALKNKKIKEHKTWECDVCDRRFTNPSNCKIHVQQQHTDKQLPKQTPQKKQSKSKAPKKKRWPCKFCKKSFVYKSNMEWHSQRCMHMHSDDDYEDSDDGRHISNAECQSEDGEDGRNTSNAECQPDDDDEESQSSGQEGNVRDFEKNTPRLIYMCTKCEAVAIDMDTAVVHSQFHQLPDYVLDVDTCKVCYATFETQHLDDHSQLHDQIDDGFMVVIYNPYTFLDNDWPDRIRISLENFAMDIETSEVQQEG